MEKLNYNNESETFHGMLNISDERNAQLEDKMRTVLRKVKSGEITNDADVLKGFLEIPENRDEEVYVAFQAGRKVEEFSNFDANPLGFLASLLKK